MRREIRADRAIPASESHVSAVAPDDIDEDQFSHCSTDQHVDNLFDLLGERDPTVHFDSMSEHMSSQWLAAMKAPGSKILASQRPELNTLLCLGRVLMGQTDCLNALVDKPNDAAARKAAEAWLLEAGLARSALVSRLNFFQLLATGLDDKAAAALAEAAAFKRRAASEDGAAMAGLPIACPHLAELYESFKRKAVEKAVKALHDPPAPAPDRSAKLSPPQPPDDDDDPDSLRVQLDKERACAMMISVFIALQQEQPLGCPRTLIELHM